MKRILSLLLLALTLSAATASAQGTFSFGYIHYDSLLHAMPEYADAQAQLAQLRQQYEKEATYNEKNFKRLFADFLQGQKDFPQNILLKRQRDLQVAMERSLAYRQEADSLLREAELEMINPLRQRLDAAIRDVGTEQGYRFILNLDHNACPFINPAAGQDATPFVREKLAQ